ncbi:MAG: Rrf2 family transcriptional regulator [Caldilineae bacterium]|nr:MAG: Rrf2 family transcriptional regulator [Caldilineae bacterium]
MFQITRRADYAVRIMVELGEQENDQPIPARKVAQRTGVPQPFLHKIVSELVKEGLVSSQAGPSGGLRLNRPTTQITLRQILEAVEGPLCINVCLLRPGECPRDITCPVHGFWGRLQTSIMQQLEGATLDKLIAEARLLRKSPSRQNVPYVYPDIPDAG